MFEIELTDPRYSICDCCGGKLTNVTRFVYKDGVAFAMYYATFGEGHPEKGVYLAIGIDDDWDEVESTSRIAFSCFLHANDLEYQVSLTDRSESPWGESKVLGRMLDREDALSHPLINQVFQLTDQIVENDPAINKLFNGDTTH